MQRERLRIATRKSPLALWQAHFIADALVALWPKLQIELLPMVTTGDKFLKDKVLAIGGKGVFVKELEDAMLHGKADLAVHSMKDVPFALPPGLTLAATCLRHNPLDALVSTHYSHLDQLPVNAVVGTVSLRRQSQLLALRPDLSIKPLRGNIHTRIAKMERGEYDAIVLAAAGLERMGLLNEKRFLFSEEQMLPSCGQGALGIECRAEDNYLQKLLAPLNDRITAICVQCERHVSALLGGNCHTPLAVFCTPYEDDQLWLRVKVASSDGKKVIQTEQRGLVDDALSLAESAVATLIDEGAQQFITM